ncbi:MAG: hypothetical protein IPG63_14335 [Xanthomonadales bacterium]|nr:hypothetical protein [Xanthomonadales bacterium]
MPVVTHRLHGRTALLLALVCAAFPERLQAQAPDAGFLEVPVEHYGHERIVAGPNLPAGLGLTTTPPYAAADVTISGNGTRLWFVLYNHFQNPRHQVFSIGVDGSSPAQSALSGTVNDPGTTLNGLFVRTDLDGDIAMLDSTTQFWRILGAGAPMQLMFDLTGPNYALADGQQRLTHDGTLGVFLDRWQLRVFRVDLTAPSPAATPIATAAFFSYLGMNPRSMFGFDLSADGGHWYVGAENHDYGIGRNRYWINHGSGTVAPTRVVENIGDDAQPVSRDQQVSDDGSRFGYCVDGVTGVPASCFLQSPGSAARVHLHDGARYTGRMVLADDGSRVYLLSDPQTGNPYGYFQSADALERRVAGSQRLLGSPNPFVLRAQLSDDGRTLVGPSSLGVYVLRDGEPAPTDFTRALRVLYRYDPGTDELVTRVQIADGGRGLERIYTLPLWRGLEPTRYLGEVENPLYWDRSGGGVNWSTTFTPVDGHSGWHERRMPLQGKLGRLNADFQFRLVVVEGSGHRTALYDVTPRPYVHFDGFETAPTFTP